MSNTKKMRQPVPFRPNKISTTEAAAAVDRDPPLQILLNAVHNGIPEATESKSVVYWMRMGDLRVADNRALSLASVRAHNLGAPLLVLFILSPQDYIAHDRSKRRIDFTLRNLEKIQRSLAEHHIPLDVWTHPVRRTLSSAVVSYLKRMGATSLFANIEYEVDELRRDISICELSKADGIQATFVHDKCVIEPGVLATKQGKVYTVYSPFRRSWEQKLNANPQYWKKAAELHPNAKSIYESELYGPLFNTPVPSSLEGFELSKKEKENMVNFFPAGEDAAIQVLQRFLTTKARTSQLGAVSPLAPDAKENPKESRVTNYAIDRSRVDKDTSSRLSPYLAAGVISVRECIRATMKLKKGFNKAKVDVSKDSGVGVWVQEIAWRDFYVHVLAACPRVSMGRPFLEKYADVVWEDYQEQPERREKEAVKAQEGQASNPGESVRRWKEGMTGYPIVDAGMRCINEMGWVHNRLRMIVAMFLTKDLMIDWRVGERYFMENLIDGDLAANNGGWQWSASTGTDAAPYFRIFNPYSQSEKVDPAGDFIRRFVPELASLKGKDIHKPPPHTADKLGYPRPIIQHEEARVRALRRFKNPGEA
ncbi:hypothetical protein CCMSSC00406_0001411 [Pleurotus cornucopiae]|uniref:Uncharacterized protein n=1 Tax=Pleurotus cornucopiae TaxID=5321 RepID=A0ACB7IMD4_PLECO|nr:hypothetical protein CCMSSC00406_0001411 [Pleurotus cornucopiae]